MLMANQVQNLDNLFSGVQCYPGYFNNSGGVAPQGDTTKEIYTDYIDTDKWAAGDYVYFFGRFPVNSGSWFAIAAYDENDGFLSRPTSSGGATNPAGDEYIAMGCIQIPSSAKKIKLSARTYGGELFACKAQDFSDAIPFAEVI